MSSVFAQSLQIALQEPAAYGALAALSVGLFGMSIRSLVGAVVSDDESGADADGHACPSNAGQASEDGPKRRAVSDGGEPNSVRRTAADGSDDGEPTGRRRSDGDEAEFEHRLDHLEEEVDELSSTVEAVQDENEQIAESVEDVNGNLQKLLNLSGSVARGVNPFSRNKSADEEPTDAFQQNREPSEPPRDDVNRHQPVQHDKVETIPGGTGAAEEFDRMEEEVEELDTLSFSDDTGGSFGEREDEDLGQEEVIDGPEPAPTADAIGDGGTLIETKEEELDIEPGSVSTPSVSQEPPETDDGQDPEVESGFEFGVKPAGNESEEERDAAEEASGVDARPVEVDEAIVESVEVAFEDTEGAVPRESDTDSEPTPDETASDSMPSPATEVEPTASEEVESEPAPSEETEADSESTPLDDQTEAELAAAEAAFAAEFDADDELALDLDVAEDADAALLETEEQQDDPAPSVEAEPTQPTETTQAPEPATEPESETDSTESEPDATSTDTDSVTAEPDAQGATESAPAPVVRADTERSLSQHVSVQADGKPYIESLPEGYSTELLVVEWLEALVDDIGVHGTARAIQYYESLDWITTDVADQLDTYLHAFESSDADTLGIDQHLRSLEYVDELARSETTPEDNE